MSPRKLDFERLGGGSGAWREGEKGVRRDE
jgi:hypothetical protein